MNKVENFPTGTIIKIGDVFGHLTVVDIDNSYQYYKDQVLILVCDCKDQDINQIQIQKYQLKIKPQLCCNLIDCKYNPTNWITINDQEYSLLPGSIIGWLEIGERVNVGVGKNYNLSVVCIGDCNSHSFEITKKDLSKLSHFDCGDSNCCSFNNRLENNSLYVKWLGIKARLFNSNNPSFISYAEIIIGTKMEKSWIHNFSIFEDYINNLLPTKKEVQLLYPGERISLDRKDNNLGYIEGNLRWATDLMQVHNRRHSILIITIINIQIDHKINKLTIQQLTIKYNMLYDTVYKIINYKGYTNNITECINEYQQSKTICGLTLQKIEEQGGLKETDIIR